MNQIKMTNILLELTYFLVYNFIVKRSQKI
jgi:hypothetical protein